MYGCCISHEEAMAQRAAGARWVSCCKPHDAPPRRSTPVPKQSRPAAAAPAATTTPTTTSSKPPAPSTSASLRNLFRRSDATAKVTAGDAAGYARLPIRKLRELIKDRGLKVPRGALVEKDDLVVTLVADDDVHTTLDGSSRRGSGSSTSAGAGSAASASGDEQATPSADVSKRRRTSVEPLRSGSVRFWSQGVPSGAPSVSLTAARNAERNSRLLTAVDITKWEAGRLEQLAQDRGIALSDDAKVSSASIVDHIRAGSLRVRDSPAADEAMGGWLGAHRNFRAFADAMATDMAAVVEALHPAAGSSTAAPISHREAADRAAKVVTKLDRIEAALTGHGGWEERTLFAFMEREFPTFKCFNERLQAEHGDSHELSDEIRSHVSAWCSSGCDAGTDAERAAYTRRLEHVVDLLREFSADLHRHLEAEEDCVVPLMCNLSDAQVGRFNATNSM